MLRVPSQVCSLSLGKTRFVAAEFLQRVGFALPVVGVIWLQANGFFCGLQCFFMTTQLVKYQRFVMPGGFETWIQLKSAVISDQRLVVVTHTIQCVAFAIPGLRKV